MGARRDAVSVWRRLIAHFGARCRRLRSGRDEALGARGGKVCDFVMMVLGGDGEDMWAQYCGLRSRQLQEQAWDGAELGMGRN